MKRILSILVALMLMAQVGGCRAPNQGDTTKRLVSRLNPQAVAVGETSHVECALVDETGSVALGSSMFTVTPEEGVLINGKTIVPNKEGNYTVACYSAEHDDLIAEQAVLVVTSAFPATEAPTGSIEESDPVQVQTFLTKNDIRAGESVVAKCVVTDAVGAVLSDASTTLQRARRLSINDKSITATAAGIHDITCSVDGHRGLKSIPAILKVKPLEPKSVELFMDPEMKAYKVGSKLMVRWTVRDPHGNRVEGLDGSLQVASGEAALVEGTPNTYKLDTLGPVTFTINVPMDSGDPLTATSMINVAKEQLVGDDDLPQLDVPYVPTEQVVVDEMLRKARITSDDVVYDLGCGDGRQVITAAKRHGARGVGVDIDPARIRESRKNAAKANVEHLVTFYQQDLFETDFSEATVMLMYLLPQVNLDLRPKILSELKPGSRIVSHDFDMGHWEADEKEQVESSRYVHDVFYWMVPANVAGTWRWESTSGEDSETIYLKLDQYFQNISGGARYGETIIPISETNLKGADIGFQIVRNVDGREVKMNFSGKVSDDTIEGTVGRTSGDGEETAPWKAQRITTKTQ